MNAKNIINYIERNHEVMEAHIQKLATIAPNSDIIQSARQGNQSVSDLLEATVNAHVQGAANALCAMAEVQEKFNNMTPYKSDTPNNPPIIDVEVVSIERKGADDESA